MIDTAAIAAIAALDEFFNAAFAIFDDAQIRALDHDSGIREVDDLRRTGNVKFAKLFARFTLARVTNSQHMDRKTNGKLFERADKLALRTGFLIDVRQRSHQVINEEKLAAIAANRHGKNFKNGFRLIMLEDFVVVEEEEFPAVILRKPLLNLPAERRHLLTSDRIVFQANVIRAGTLEVNPLLKFLFTKLPRIGADAVALLDCIEKKQAGQSGFSVARITGKNGETALNQTTNGCIQRGDHRLNPGDGGRVIRSDRSKIEQALNRNLPGVLDHIDQLEGAEREEDFVRVLTFFPTVFPIRIIFDDGASRFIQPFRRLLNHLAAGVVVIAEENNALEFFQPVPAVLNPAEILAAGGDGDDVRDAGLIKGHGVQLPFRYHKGLSEGTHIHPEEHGLCAGGTPLLSLFALFQLPRPAEFFKNIDAVLVKREDDHTGVVGLDFESVDRLAADAALFKVLINRLGGRVEMCIGEFPSLWLLFGEAAGGTSETGDAGIAEEFSQLVEMPALAAAAALTDKHAFINRKGEGFLIPVLAAMAEGAILRDDFFAPVLLGFYLKIPEILIREPDHLISVIHINPSHSFGEYSFGRRPALYRRGICPAPAQVG